MSDAVVESVGIAAVLDRSISAVAGASGICSASGVEVSSTGTCVESTVSSGVKFDASWEGICVEAAITSVAMAEVSSTGMGAAAVVASEFQEGRGLR